MLHSNFAEEHMQITQKSNRPQITSGLLCLVLFFFDLDEVEVEEWVQFYIIILWANYQ